MRADYVVVGEGSATVLAIAIVAIPLMFVTIVVGELVPKALQIQLSDLCQTRITLKCFTGCTP